MKPQFRPGKNLAMKVPANEFERTVAFYRDIIGFKEIEGSSSNQESHSARFQFGDKNLWIDKVETLSQAEIWLEIEADDIEKASRYLKGLNCIRRDEVEPLPKGFRGFWICNPANIIHLISETDV